MATCYNNLTQVNQHQYTGISILCWNVYHVFMLQIFFSYPFHHIVDTTVRVQITGCKLHCSVIRHKQSHYSLHIWRTLQKQSLGASEIGIKISMKAHCWSLCFSILHLILSEQSHKVTVSQSPNYFVFPHLSFIFIPQREMVQRKTVRRIKTRITSHNLNFSEGSADTIC